MAYIYKITNDINERVYIGATIRPIQQRFSEHKYNSKVFTDRPLYKAMNEIGVEHFKVEMIEECTNSLKDMREIYWINRYKSMTYGYNGTYGGKGRHNCNYNQIAELYENGLTPNDIHEVTGYTSMIIEKVLLAEGIPIEELKSYSHRRKPTLKSFPVAKFCSGCKNIVRADKVCYFCGKEF